MNLTRLLFLAAFLGASLSLVNAQQPPRRPGGGFTPGGGGTGGFPGTTGPIDRLKNKSVAEEIKISQDQIDKLKSLSEELPAKIQAAVNAETFRQLGDVLTAEQIKRLKQIEVQAAGLAAFTQPEVVAAIRLNDDQKTQIETIRSDVRTKTRELFTTGGGGRPNEEKMAENRKKMREVVNEGMDRAQAVLTAEQQATWKGLVGEPFDVSTLPPPFRFGQPGAGGGFPGTRPPQPKD